MSKTDPKFRDERFSGLCSSEAIFEACEDVAGFEFDLDDQENCQAYRVWASPTQDEAEEVVKCAWTYAEDDEDTLHWGSTTIRRS
jgi:hypothetical protein